MKKITKIDGVQNNSTKKKKLQVTAYCRVSTGSDAQLENLETQKTYMNDTSILMRIGSSPVSTLMKMSLEPKQKNVHSCFA